jgi:hypothetical protein
MFDFETQIYEITIPEGNMFLTDDRGSLFETGLVILSIIREHASVGYKTKYL